MQESSLAKIPHLNVKLELDDRLIHKVIKKATNHLEVGKSPGTDGISAEVYQHGGEAVFNKLKNMFTNCQEKGTLPQDLRDAVTVSLYKNKGEKADCSNYRGIPLLYTAGKIMARVLLDSLILENIPESLCVFRSNRRTADVIFVMRPIQGTCREQNIGLCGL